MEKKSNGLSIGALVCGVIAVILCFIPVPGGALFVALAALVLGIVAIVLAAKGMKAAKTTGTGRGLAIAGLVTGIVATAICGLAVLCVICAVGIVAAGAAGAAGAAAGVGAVVIL